MKSTLKLQPAPGLVDHAQPDLSQGHNLSSYANDAQHATGVQPKQDASALQGLLIKEFAQPEEAEKKTAKLALSAQPLSPIRSRILKSVAGLVILASVGWMPLQRLFQVSSVEAVVNAQVTTLRAPIGGVVSEGPSGMRVGSTVAPGDLLVTVQNARADYAGIERATRDLQSATEDLTSTEARIDRLTALRAVIAARVEAFRADRVRRVDTDLDVADAQIASAQAVMDRAAAEAARQSALTATGIGTQAVRQTAERDLAVARASADQAKAQKKLLKVEAEALKAGRFFGNSYDDVPQSVQRLDEMDENLASLQVEKGRLETRAVRLASGLQNEQGRFDLASQAAIVVPAGGQIWEILTSPGEQVVAGQPLVSVLNCSKLVVTAAVTESVYNTLSVGMPASFTLSEGGSSFNGQVVQLSGIAAAGSNFAIVPSALTKEPYRATVSVDNLAGNGACPVGQTGRVVFGGNKS